MREKRWRGIRQTNVTDSTRSGLLRVRPLKSIITSPALRLVRGLSHQDTLLVVTHHAWHRLLLAINFLSAPTTSSSIRLPSTTRSSLVCLISHCLIHPGGWNVPSSCSLLADHTRSLVVLCEIDILRTNPGQQLAGIHTTHLHSTSDKRVMIAYAAEHQDDYTSNDLKTSAHIDVLT